MPRRPKWKPTIVGVKIIRGRIFLYENSEMVMELKPGQVFNGSSIGNKGQWAKCTRCGARHSIGLRCAACEKAKDRERRDHKDIAKPEIKGI